MVGLFGDWFAADWVGAAITGLSLGGGFVVWFQRQREKRREAKRWPLGFSLTRHTTLGNIENKVEWLLLEVSISNLKGHAASVIEYGMSVIVDKQVFARSIPVHYQTLPNGDPLLEDPLSGKCTAVAGSYEFLETPVNLAAHESRQGWLAFHFREPVTREDVACKPLIVALVDGVQTQWIFVMVLGEAKPRQHFHLNLELAKR